MEFLKTEGRFITDGKKRVLLRGFGLGGWFLPEGYMWKLYTKCDRPRRMETLIEELCGPTYAEEFWEEYLDQYITRKDIEWIAAEGFNSVRLPLNARHLYTRTETGLVLNQKMLQRIDTLLDWCRENEIYVILDMHAAPGGQTGQNIDDSESGHPELFMDSAYEEELIFLWKELSLRYKDRPEVAAYDLLNEPLPEFFCQYNDKVLPLYRRLIAEIRRIDPQHIIMLEGVHWASDFSIFDAFTREEAQDNLVLQFHKYWNHPDKESLQVFQNYAERLQVPLYMGEGGENNCEWYAMAFPLYESLQIGWSFWTYKKMDCKNSPVSFAMPEEYEELIAYIEHRGTDHEGIDRKSADHDASDYECTFSRERAVEIFDCLLYCIRHPVQNYEVIHALKREVPFCIPAEGYDECVIVHDRIPGADFRRSDPVTILFVNGKTGKVDFQRMGGEEQPEEENLQVLLREGDTLSYLFTAKAPGVKIEVTTEGVGELEVTIQGNNEFEVIAEKDDELLVTEKDDLEPTVRKQEKQKGKTDREQTEKSRNKSQIFPVEGTKNCRMEYSIRSTEKRKLLLRVRKGYVNVDTICFYNIIEYAYNFDFVTKEKIV